MKKQDLKQIKEVIDESISVNNEQIKQVIDESISVNNEQIKQVIDESISSNNKVLRKELMLDFGQFVEDNINPQFQSMDERFDKIDKRFDTIDQSRHQDNGDLRTAVKREDKKINKLSSILYRKKVITKTDLKQVEQVK